MSSDINIHTNTWQEDYKGSVRFFLSKTWPITMGFDYQDGGPTIAGNSRAQLFINQFDNDEQAVRDMATSAQTMTDGLFAWANEIRERKQQEADEAAVEAAQDE